MYIYICLSQCGFPQRVLSNFPLEMACMFVSNGLSALLYVRTSNFVNMFVQHVFHHLRN